jgi:hypothetical protein
MSKYVSRPLFLHCITNEYSVFNSVQYHSNFKQLLEATSKIPNHYHFDPALAGEKSCVLLSIIKTELLTSFGMTIKFIFEMAYSLVHVNAAQPFINENGALL